ncbi:MAG: ATP-binding cassette domain-containing protein, partial [Terriglobales bacterium]
MTAEAGSFRLGPIGFFLPAGERLFLTGPTGSGKSLLLRIIAGVAAPRGGRITLDGADLGAMAPEGRQTGWLPQETMLFPHLDGRQNIEFGASGAPPPARPGLWPTLIAQLEIEPLLARRPEGLSGGEQQRLALARALWRQPR